MERVRIEFVKETKLIDDVQVRQLISALRTQVQRDFLPVWGIDADVVFLSKKSESKRGSWRIALLDNADQAGYLGYHFRTFRGKPFARVFVKTDMENDVSWTVTASDELLELLADPEANLFAQDVLHRRMVAYEVCDPCEPDRYAYRIGDVLVSDFVYPAWFESFHKPGSTRFDHKEYIRRPFQRLPGGHVEAYYFRVRRTGKAMHDWTVTLADARKERLTQREHSRVS